MMSLEPDNNRTLIDELIAEQQTLTPVDRFAQRNGHHVAPSQEKFYRDLIPLTQPQPGQQYAFEVDLDKCSGCKACVSACHSLNGLDEDEMWRSVGLLVGGVNDECRMTNVQRSPTPEARNSDFDIRNSFVIRHSSFGFFQHITTACHHCVDPGCLNGCPVLAYDKDPLTGIVRHLDDQCIGCQYCVMKCPYDVPKYSAKRGIVRKCDMCHSRLAVGEAPACVQACPSEAIRITLVETHAIETKYLNGSSRRKEALISKAESGKAESGTIESLLTSAATGNGFLPASPDPRITLPSTRYKSSKPLPANLLAGDHSRVTPADSHLPLVFMLVLTQLSVGASIMAIFSEPSKWLTLVAAVMGALALGIASLHLGKPLKAWRAFLGWRKSWFSREVIVFGAFVPLATAATFASEWQQLFLALKIATAAAGLLGVICSAMIYADTHREFWRASQCLGKFFGTTLLLGVATTLTIQTFAQSEPNYFFPLIALLAAATVVKLGFEHRIFRHLVDENTPTFTPLNKSARLIEGELGFAYRARIACGIFSGLILPVILVANRGSGSARFTGLAMLMFCIAGELLERYLFFRAVAPVKMPGGVAA